MLAVHDVPGLARFRAPGVFPHFSGGSGTVRWAGRWEPGADNDEILGSATGGVDGGPAT